MMLDKESRRRLPRIVGMLLSVVDKMPDTTFVDISLDSIKLQAETHREATALHAHFPDTEWSVVFEPMCKWWEHHATIDGLAVDIYAIKHAPGEPEPPPATPDASEVLF